MLDEVEREAGVRRIIDESPGSETEAAALLHRQGRGDIGRQETQELHRQVFGLAETIRRQANHRAITKRGMAIGPSDDLFG